VRQARRALEREARDASFEPLRSTLAELSMQAGYTRPVALRYHARHANALHATQEEGVAAVVVGLRQRALHNRDPVLSRAMLAHELSHLELGARATEERMRRALLIYLALLGLLVAYFFSCLAYLDTAPAQAESALELRDLVPVLDGFVLSRLLSHTYLLAVTTAGLFVLAYFFLVRRELGHDLRASQLIGSVVLAERLFRPECTSLRRAPWSRRLWQRLHDFLGLHPSACERARVIEDRDLVLLRSGLYPAIMGMFFPALFLLIIGFRGAVGASEARWNLIATLAMAALMFFILRPDSVRLGVKLAGGGVPLRA
jgi:hypothetical protein